jgi:hypothetical protein
MPSYPRTSAPSTDATTNSALSHRNTCSQSLDWVQYVPPHHLTYGRNTSRSWTVVLLFEYEKDEVQKYRVLETKLLPDGITTFAIANVDTWMPKPPVKPRKATIGFVLCFFCLSVRMEKFGYHWTDLHEILYFTIFRKSVKKIQVSLKSDKNNVYFTCRPMYIYNNISLNSS